MKDVFESYFICVRIIGNNYKQICLITIGRILIAFITIISTYLSALIVNDIVLCDIDYFNRNIVAIIFLKCIEKVLSYRVDKSEIEIKKQTNIQIKQKIIKYLYRCDSQEIEKSGKLFNIIYVDSMAVCNFVFVLNNFFVQILSMITILVLMIRINWIITLLLIVCFPCLLIINEAYGNKIKQLKVVSYKKTDIFVEYIKIFIVNIVQSNINGYSTFIEDTTTRLMENIKDTDLDMDIKSLNAKFLTKLWKEIMNLFIIVMAGYDVINGISEVGNYLAISSYGAAVASNIESFSYLINYSQQQKLSVSRVGKMFDEQYEEFEKDFINKLKPKISLSDVDISIGEVPLIDKVNIDINKNGVYLITGKNGVGKTTLLKSICGLVPFDSGNIQLGDIDITDIRYYHLQSIISFVMQNTMLFNEISIKDNLLMGNELLEAKMHELCRKMGLEEDINKYEDGYDTIVSSAEMFSAGQRKKIHLIRGLLKEADIYFFDEPTDNLDPTSKEAFFKIINKLKDNKIIILVSHEEVIGEYINIKIESKGLSCY